MADDPLLIRGAATIAKHIKEGDAEDGTSRRRLLPAMMKKKGTVIKNSGGDGFRPLIRWKEATVEGHNGAQSITPQPLDDYKSYRLDYYGLVTTNRLSLREFLSNKDSDTQLVNLFNKIGGTLETALANAMCENFYSDTPTSKPWGIRSFFGYTQTFQLGASTPTGRTRDAGDPLGYPSDTYGLSTIQGNYGGAWDGDYVTGSGTADLDFFVPIIVQAKSTFFEGTTWKENSANVIGWSQHWSLRQHASDEPGANFIMLPGRMWQEYARRFDGKERVILKEALDLPEYGQDQQRGIIDQDGAIVTSEFDVPNNKGFGWNWDNIRMRCMGPDMYMLDKDSPKWWDTESHWHWITRMLYQWEFGTPRNFVMIDNSY